MIIISLSKNRHRSFEATSVAPYACKACQEQHRQKKSQAHRQQISIGNIIKLYFLKYKPSLWKHLARYALTMQKKYIARKLLNLIYTV